MSVEVPGSTGIARAGRVLSVDALRGFDMLWIAGADGLIQAIARISESPVARFFSSQLRHVRWQGFVFYDLIFPLFVFLVGMSIVFSLDRIIEKEGIRAAHMRILRRFALLYLLAMLKDSGISDLAHESPFSGVLQRMAWCYLFTALLYCNLRRRGLAIVCVTILVGYWILLTFVPPPGQTEISYESDKNIVTWFDSQYLPFREAGQKYDPEGLLSTFPAVATCLFGVFAGYAMRNGALNPRKRALTFLAIGLVLVVLGFSWAGDFQSYAQNAQSGDLPSVDEGRAWWQMPVIKKIWTSSYVLVAGGWSCILVGLFSMVIDVWRYERWAIPFIWIGANPLAVYLAQDFIAFDELGRRVSGGPFAMLFGNYAPIIPALASIGFVFLFAWFLYKKKIFLRV
ncbi:MAG TPA: heparan-alpha-glucosaminide N-acetyltransferase domain-containing protein [Candidatus Hydrogenedentes bacterium]|nr:heparan-alpha-glucosaminide N-acetyltransferase domain-containing protein [Candidatus Hydrogenedentota bacterium]